MGMQVICEQGRRNGICKMTWPMVKLGDVCDLQNGYAFKSSDYVDFSNTLNIRMSNIRPGGIFDSNHNQRFLPDSFSNKYAAFSLKDGDLIIAMTDMANDPKILGVPTIVSNLNGRVFLLNQRVGRLFGFSNNVYVPFLKFILNSHLIKNYYKRLGAGGVQINIGKEDILSAHIPLPLLHEQQRIAALLEKVDHLRALRRQALKRLDDLVQATFLEMFGDPVTNLKGWKTVSLSNLAMVRSGVTKGRKLNADEIVEIPYMRVANVQDGYLNLSEIKTIEVLPSDIKKYALESGDVLLTEGGDLDKLGRGAIWQNEIVPCIHQNHIFCVRLQPEYVMPEYFSSLIGSRYGKNYFFKQAKQTTGIASINSRQLKAFPVQVPPLELQKRYSKFVLTLEIKKNSYKGSLTKLDTLFNTLMHQAFSGELNWKEVEQTIGSGQLALPL
jgi:type I restriction enzyme S subunit